MKSFSTLIKHVAAKPLNTGMFIIVLMLSLGLGTAQAKDRINYFHSDISGSPIAAMDAEGELLWEETYKPYGERLNTDNSNKTNNNQWYTGKQEEVDLGLQYFGARWYHQASGRFISRDPAGVLAHVEDNPMMFNRYAYGNNNPYRYVDPDGRIPVDTIWDAGNIIYDVGKIAVGWGTGNAAMVASGTTDLALDAAAFIVPYAPAGLTKIGGTAKSVGKKADDVIHVTKDGVALPPGAKHKIPDNYVQNPHRSGNYGEIVDGKYKERLRIDPPTPSGQKGPNYSHYHKNGKGTHYSPKSGDKDPGF